MSTIEAGIAPLFRPIELAGCQVPNRIVMAPMTRGFVQEYGVLAESAVDYYRRRAEGGIGLILTEGIATSDLATQHARVPMIDGESALAMWVRVVGAVHDAGARIMAQLWHTGLGRNREKSLDPSLLSVGPMDEFLVPSSTLVEKGGNHLPGRAMTLKDIEDTILEFGAAAAQARRAGFDGIQLHAAHGYLIDQFFWGESNRREDHYGGGIAARTRFAVDIIQEIRHQAGPDFPIGLRFSQWKLPAHYQVKAWESVYELETFLNPLIDAGVDFFDASTRRYWEAEFRGSELSLAAWTKKLSGRPTISVGSVGLAGVFEPYNRTSTAQPESDLSRIVSMIERDEVDMVGVGRALLTNPDWVNKIRDGAYSELKPYTPAALADHW